LKSYRIRLLIQSEMQIFEYELDIPGKGHSYFEAPIMPSAENEVIAIIRDITKLKQEQLELLKLRTAIEQSNAGIVITDSEGVIEYANPGFELVTGYKSSELIGQNPKILNSGSKPKSFYKELWDTILNGKTWKGEFYNKRKSGSFYWESAIISPVFDEKGEITHFVGVKEDITENKKLIQELRKAKDKAEESDRLKTAFLTNMSHEIRTPLNAVVGFSTLISSKKLSDEKLSKYSKLISQNAGQLLHVINDILDISKIEANQVELHFVDMNVNQELDDIHKMAFSILGENRVKVNMKVVFACENLTISTDIVRFRQIMMNLLSNAIKFTNRGQIKFGYRLDDNILTFFVKDTGLGIPKAMHDAVFERFQQARIQSDQFFGGTGLGLSIAKTYTELLGGSIWFESEEGKGTTFYFTLPL
jgi:PAS domain S-box-containing protein